jgi:hypothetical protein
MSSNKREVAMPILSDSQCVKNHRVNPAQQICAGVPFAGKDTCQVCLLFFFLKYYLQLIYHYMYQSHFRATVVVCILLILL